MNNININPKYEKILRELKILTKYKANVKRYKKERLHSGLGYFDPNTKTTFVGFILHSFNWHSSPEGYDFWSKIALNKTDFLTT